MAEIGVQLFDDVEEAFTALKAEVGKRQSALADFESRAKMTYANNVTHKPYQ